MTSSAPQDIHHQADATQGAFFTERDGKRIAELTYTLAGDEMAIEHSWVDPAARGGGLARPLIDAAIDWARAHRRKVVPYCPYVKSVCERTPEYADVVKPS